LDGTNQLLGKYISIVQKITQSLLYACRKFGPEVNTDKTIYIWW